MSRHASLAAVLLLLPSLAGAQALVGRSETVFQWHGAIGAHGRLNVRNFNGPIEVRAATGNQVELRAEKRMSGGASAEDVAFSIGGGGDGDVTICSTWHGRNPCDGEHGWSDDDNYRGNVSVAMTLLVPRGASVKVSTGNGGVTVERVGNEVQASTGNGRVRVTGTEGSVRVSTGNGDVEIRDVTAPVHVSTGNGDVTVATAAGPVSASTGHGDIDVRMTTLKARDDMSFSTGSGSVSLHLPANYAGELDASTGNGGIRSDFELHLQGRMNPRHVRATIGAGGPLLRMSSGNGELEILKS